MKRVVAAAVLALLWTAGAWAQDTPTPTVTATQTATPTQTFTPTVTQTRTVTPTATRTAGPGDCCQCEGTCTNPVSGSCGSCILVLNAACGVVSGECGTYTPTPLSTLTPVSTWTTIPTSTPVPPTATKTQTPTATSFGTAGPTPFSRVPQDGNIIQGIAWTTKTAVGTAFDPYPGHKYCIYAIDFNVVALASTVNVTSAGNVLFDSSGPKYLFLGKGGPCVPGPITVTESTGSDAFRVTIGTFIEPPVVGTNP